MSLLPTKSHKPSDTLFKDLRTLITEARQDVARQVNSGLVLLYRRVGQRIRKDILKEKRAEYDPYFLGFPGLKDTYSEKDLETAILRELEPFKFAAMMKHQENFGELDV